MFFKLIKSLTKIEKLLFGGATIVFIISGLILGIEIIQSNTRIEPAVGGEYIEGLVGQPALINPILGTTDVDKSIIRLIFNDLTELAESITDEENRIWTIRLKDNIFWHDGESITSDDIIFTIQLAQNPNTYSPLFTTWQGVIAERISEKEARLTIRTPYVFFRDNLKDLLIVPKHIFMNIPTTNIRLSDYIIEAVGSGSYKFESLQKRRDGFIKKYSLKANENYFGKKPYIEKIEFKFYVKSDELIKAINAGEIDGFGTFEPKLLSSLTRTHQLSSLIIPQYYAVFLNQNSSIPLKDKNVRLALNLAIDRKRIIEEVTKNQAIKINGPLVPVSVGYNTEINKEEDFSKNKANEILDGSGWKMDNENLRSKIINQNAVGLEFNLIIPDSPSLVNAGKIIKENLEAIGARVNLDILDTETINRDIIPTRNYQMILFGNITGRQPDFFSFWHSSQRFHPGLNLALYQNKTADNLIESIRQDTNAQKRKGDINTLQSVIVGDKPAIFLYSPKYLYVRESKLGGSNESWILSPGERFDNIENWYVETNRILK